MIFDFVGIISLLFASAFGFDKVIRSYYVINGKFVDFSLIAWGVALVVLGWSIWRAKRGQPFLFCFMLVWTLVALAFELCFFHIFAGDEQAGERLRWLLWAESVGLCCLLLFKQWKMAILLGGGLLLSFFSQYLLFPKVIDVAYLLWGMGGIAAWWLISQTVQNEKLRRVLRGIGGLVAVLGVLFAGGGIYLRLSGIRFYESKILEPAKEVKVSIIVPVYNAEKGIERCLDSLRRQTLKDIEIIAVDDGSTDKTPEILARYAAHDARIRVIRQENAYIGAARNHGLREAKGEFVGFVDSDDWVSPEFYEELYKTAVRGENDVVLAKNVHMVRQIRPWYIPEVLKKVEYSPQDKDIFFHEDNKPFISYVWNKIYKREFIEQNDIWFTTYRTVYEDGWFSFLIRMYAKNFEVADRGVYYYSRGERVTASSGEGLSVDKLVKDEAFEMFVAFEEKIKNALKDEAEKEVLLKEWRRKVGLLVKDYYNQFKKEDKKAFFEKCVAVFDEDFCLSFDDSNLED